MDELFDKIITSGLGCRIDQYNYSILGYADDLTLISPSCEGLQKMITMVEQYCTVKGLRLSVDPDPKKSKTKCIHFNSKRSPQMLTVYNTQIPWVNTAVHLGHVISSDEDTRHDTNSKRCAFVSKVHALRQELGDQDPSVFLKLLNIYASSFYGSNLWDLGDDSSTKLYSAWNRSIKFTYNLPINTHRYMLASLYNKADLKSTLIHRFHRFRDHLINCDKPEVIYLARIQQNDIRSTFGKNISLQDTSDQFIAPISEEWRVPVVKELLEVRSGRREVGHFNLDEVEDILNALCGL
jgi:hypothetical protein